MPGNRRHQGAPPIIDEQEDIRYVMLEMG